MSLVFKCDRCGEVGGNSAAAFVKVNSELAIELCAQCEHEIRVVLQKVTRAKEPRR